MNKVKENTPQEEHVGTPPHTDWQPCYDLMDLLGLDRGEFGRPPSVWMQLQPCRAGNSCQTGLRKFMFVLLPYDMVKLQVLPWQRYNHCNSLQEWGRHGQSCLKSPTIRPHVANVMDTPTMMLHPHHTDKPPYHGNASFILRTIVDLWCQLHTCSPHQSPAKPITFCFTP